MNDGNLAPGASKTFSFVYAVGPPDGLNALALEAVEVTELTESPTDAPTKTNSPTKIESPSDAPTRAPTNSPTNATTDAPSDARTDAPTNAPTGGPCEDHTVCALGGEM